MSRLSLRHLFARLAKRPAVRRVSLSVSQLEERRNPTVTAGYDIPTGILTVNGNAGLNDRIFLLQGVQGTQRLSVFDGRSGRLIIVPIDIGGTGFGNIDINSVTGIHVNGVGGNDLLDLNSSLHGWEPILKPATVVGGSGQDSIGGGAGDDSVV